MSKLIDKLEKLKGAFSLVSKFDTLEDDNTIDKLICHAIKSGIDINDYNTVEEDEYISQLYI